MHPGNKCTDMQKCIFQIFKKWCTASEIWKSFVQFHVDAVCSCHADEHVATQKPSRSGFFFPFQWNVKWFVFKVSIFYRTALTSVPVIFHSKRYSLWDRCGSSVGCTVLQSGKHGGSSQGLSKAAAVHLTVGSFSVSGSCCCSTLTVRCNTGQHHKHKPQCVQQWTSCGLNQKMWIQAFEINIATKNKFWFWNRALILVT